MLNSGRTLTDLIFNDQREYKNGNTLVVRIKDHRSRKFNNLSARQDSNLGPQRYKLCALPTELQADKLFNFIQTELEAVPERNIPFWCANYTVNFIPTQTYLIALKWVVDNVLDAFLLAKFSQGSNHGW